MRSWALGFLRKTKVLKVRSMSTLAFEDLETELKQVHLIFRHGDRTPDHPFPNDLHQNHSYAPWGRGQLNKAGYQRMYNNGKFFRERYDKFLGPLYNQNEIHAQSTGMPRARMSLQLFCAGMFPPARTELEWIEGLNWQPINFSSLPVFNDPLLLPMFTQYQQTHDEFVSSYSEVVEKNRAFFDTLEKFIGKPIVKPMDMIGVYFLLKAQVEYGLDLPEWARDIYPEKLGELSTEAWGYFVQNEALKRLLGGNLLDKLTKDWEARIVGSSSKKMFIYSAHDLTVAGILGACNVWNPKISPEYGITAIFELRQNRKTGEYGVQIFVRNEPENEPQLLTIPGCKSFCSLDDFKKALKNHYPNTARL